MALRDEDGIFLIQGPPGTGKTTTLKMLLGAYFAVHPRPIGNVRNPHAVLLCAPSNAAVDEMLRRISSEGIEPKRSQVKVWQSQHMESSTGRFNAWYRVHFPNTKA